MRFIRRSIRRAAVFGCGPAGLFAAHALVQGGASVTIFSKKRRSEMFGAQYLHAPIPGLTDEDPVQIRYTVKGSIEEYRRKVYGDRVIRVSPEELEQTHLAWDIRKAYHKAWDLYSPLIVNKQISARSLGVSTWGDVTPEVDNVLISLGSFDAAVSSLPAPALCYRPEEHSFAAQEVWAIGDAPERGIFCPIDLAAPNEVLLNGDSETGWYRQANVFGYKTVEWPGGSKPPIADVATVTKPISTNCDCFPQILRVGRYGTWTKGVLSHTAYENVARRFGR